MVKKSLYWVNVLGFFFFAMSACQSAQSSREASDVLPVGLPAPVRKTLLSIDGELAEHVYATTKLEAVNNAFGHTKSLEGAISVACYHSGMPPGAQGIPGPTDWFCRVTGGDGDMPPGAVGQPAPAILNISGNIAMKFSDAFKVAASYESDSGQYVQRFTSRNAAFVCDKSAKNGKTTCFIAEDRDLYPVPEPTVGFPEPQ